MRKEPETVEETLKAVNKEIGKAVEKVMPAYREPNLDYTFKVETRYSPLGSRSKTEIRLISAELALIAAKYNLVYSEQIEQDMWR